jgi:uncharacterized membrane protein
MNWKLLAFIYLITIGVYAFLLKIILRHLSIKEVTLLSWGTGFLIVLFSNINYIPESINKYHIYAIAIGILLGVGIIVQYRLYAIKEISTTLPIMSQAGLISIILAVIFLSETVTLTKVLGILCGIGSIFLLML